MLCRKHGELIFKIGEKVEWKTKDAMQAGVYRFTVPMDPKQHPGVNLSQNYVPILRQVRSGHLRS
jgi:hypothetical protein